MYFFHNDSVEVLVMGPHDDSSQLQHSEVIQITTLGQHLIDNNSHSFISSRATADRGVGGLNPA